MIEGKRFCGIKTSFTTPLWIKQAFKVFRVFFFLTFQTFFLSASNNHSSLKTIT
jgi:hypothetical protein